MSTNAKKAQAKKAVDKALDGFAAILGVAGVAVAQAKETKASLESAVNQFTEGLDELFSSPPEETPESDIKVTVKAVDPFDTPNDG